MFAKNFTGHDERVDVVSRGQSFSRQIKNGIGTELLTAWP